MTSSTMTREQALEAAREMWGPRADSVQLGRAFYLGIQKSKNEFDWRSWGSSWAEAVDMARANETERKAKGEQLKEKFARIVTRIDGDTISREWHGRVYEVKRVDGGYEFAGKIESSLTAVARIITSAKAISGPRFFGVDAKSEKAS